MMQLLLLEECSQEAPRHRRRMTLPGPWKRRGSATWRSWAPCFPTSSTTTRSRVRRRRPRGRALSARCASTPWSTPSFRSATMRGSTLALPSRTRWSCLKRRRCRCHGSQEVQVCCPLRRAQGLREPSVA
eukprot:jgi/Mesen1/986/ME000012S00538